MLCGSVPDDLTRWERNDWDFDPTDPEQVQEFVQIIQRRLPEEVEQRILLCLIESEEGLKLLRNTLYK